MGRSVRPLLNRRRILALRQVPLKVKGPTRRVPPPQEKGGGILPPYAAVVAAPDARGWVMRRDVNKGDNIASPGHFGKTFSLQNVDYLHPISHNPIQKKQFRSFRVDPGVFFISERNVQLTAGYLYN
jgi:hypothetical protein